MSNPKPTVLTVFKGDSTELRRTLKRLNSPPAEYRCGYCDSINRRTVLRCGNCGAPRK